MAFGDRRVLDPASPPAAAPVAPALRRIPLVSGGIIAACAVVFLAELGRLLPGLEPGSLQLGALYGPAIADGQWWRVIGHVFEHGGILHIVLNMSVVFTLGFTLERAIGPARFALICLVTALGSATLALLFSFDLPTVGASGMILGYAGAILPIATRQGRQQIATWLVQVALISFLPGLHVSWQGHLGGFLFGLPCGLLLRNGGRFFWPVAPFLVALGAGAAWFAVHWGAAHAVP